jgi:ABC-type Fe3+-hydroxamate transport system substrate-binding protein
MRPSTIAQAAPRPRVAHARRWLAILLSCLLCAAAALTLVGCGGSEPAASSGGNSPAANPGDGFPRTIADASGAAITIAARPRRIVSQTLASAGYVHSTGAQPLTPRPVRNRLTLLAG